MFAGLEWGMGKTIFPRAVLFEVSAKTGAGLEPWFEQILASEDESGANRER